jgi:hypothetical protein
MKLIEDNVGNTRKDLAICTQLLFSFVLSVAITLSLIEYTVNPRFNGHDLKDFAFDGG